MSKITVSIPETLLGVLDRLTIAQATTRSGVMAELLRQAERRELEDKMKEGYRAMAEVDKSEVAVFLSAQAEVVQRED